MSDLQAQGLRVRIASLALAQATNLQRCAVLERVADQLEERSEEILEANARDLAAYQESGPGRDRLALDAKRVGSMASALREIAATEDPLFETSDHDTRPNGLRVERMRVPLGVVGVVYENRPNVTSDVAGLCIRSGNVAYLRGSSSAMATNELIVSMWRDALELEGLPRDAVSLVADPSYETATAFMQMTGVLDCLIPRGGPSLIAAMREHARVPYVLDGDGNCHVYVDEFADLEKALAIVKNAKTSRPGVCNAAETLIVHRAVAAEFLPAGVLNVVCGDRDTGRMLVEHPVPAMASITGSVRAGMEVASSASKSLKRVHLELGGKAPVIIFDDADIASAAENIAIAGFFNAGQDCTAATRVMVASHAYGDFVDALSEQAKNTVVGAPDNEDALFGPVNNASQLERVTGFINRKPGHAKTVAGGVRVGDSGYFIAPTVIADLHQDDEMVQNEIFGPVITVQKFADEAEALSFANGVSYALASSVWTKDHGRAMRFTRDLDFGCVWVNAHIPLVAEMPHGGFKHSGYGKDLSVYGFEDYTRIKHVMHNIEV